MKKILLSCLVLLTASCASEPVRSDQPEKPKKILTVCMIYNELGKMKCSTNGAPAVEVEFKAAEHYICMPNDDAVDVFSRMDSCPVGL